MSDKRRNGFFRLLTPFIALLLSAAALTGCDRGSDKQAVTDEQVTLVVPVKVRPAPRKNFVTYIRTTGTLRARDDVVIKSEVSGLLVEVPLDEGDVVKKGQTLARVNEEIYRYNLEEARAAVKYAQAELLKMKQIVRPQELKARKASLESAEAAYQKAEKDWERMQRLYHQQVVSKEVFDINRALIEIAEAGFKEARENYALAVEGARSEDIQMTRAMLSQAEARVGLAEKRLRDCRIAAPFGGRVARMLVETGEIVAEGTPIANVVNIERLEIEVGVVQEHIIHLREGDPATISINVYPERTFGGVISYAGIKAEAAAGAFPIIIEVDNSDGYLRPGMIATVRIAGRSVAEALVVPRDAVLERGDQMFVFTVHDGAARRRPVVLGAIQDREVVIKTGIQEGDLVVEEGQESLQDNARVSVQNGKM